jgi:DNA-binding NarL/FixJ family response regulator
MGAAAGGRVTRARVLLADDHRMVAEGLKSILVSEFDLAGVVEDGLAMVEAARTLRPDVIVADITMPRLNGIDALAKLRKDDIDIPVVFLTMHREVAYARRALEAGAAGYVLKHAAPAELVQAVRAALAGGTFVSPVLAGEVFQSMKNGDGDAGSPIASLTSRQREILRMLVEGLSAKEIGKRLEISSRTVEFHKYQLMESLGAKSSAELIHFAIRHGIV